MFGMLGSLAKAAVGVATLPVTVAADIITLGGTMTDKDKPYTADAAEKILKNLKDAADPEK